MTIALWQRPLARVVMGIVKSANGAWFDPSDLSTLYQDAAGTTPVTAVEQPVALWLDKSYGLQTGPEKISDVDFDNASSWVVDAGFVVSGGKLTINNSVAGNCYQASTNITSKVFSVTIKIDSLSSGYLLARLGGQNGIALNSAGVYKFLLRSGTINSFIGVQAAPNTVAVIDSISVRELYGYHATQSITASRPTLSARYNLLTKTEDFSAAAWVKQAAGTATAPVVTNNYGVAPDGSITAARLQLALNGGTTTTDRSCLLQQPALISGAAYASTFWVKSNTAQSYVVQQRLGVAAQNITIDQTWRAYTYSQTAASDNTHWLALRGAQGTSDAADILIWHPQLIIGTTSGPYQRVNTATDYDTDERYFPKYLRFDGVDDYLNLPYMGLYANGSASVVAGYCLNSKAAQSLLLSEANNTTSTPIYYLHRHLQTSGYVNFFIRNDASVGLCDYSDTNAVEIGVAGVKSSVDTGAKIKQWDNSADYDEVNYVRSGAVSLNTTTIGAIAYTTTSSYFNGNIYGLIITKSALTDAQRIACERHLSRKSGVIL